MLFNGVFRVLFILIFLVLFYSILSLFYFFIVLIYGVRTYVNPFNFILSFRAVFFFLGVLILHLTVFIFISL